MAEEEQQPFEASWVIWAHSPRNNNWNDTSCSKLATIATVEQAIAINALIPADVVTKCMLFVMRDGVAPLYEDPANANGGAFSYRVSNHDVPTAWSNVCYALMGETLATTPELMAEITGVTISPKKNFCIIKIWTRSLTHTNAQHVAPNIRQLNSNSCLFKPHPKY
jgi:translation initiation factor 4E